MNNIKDNEYKRITIAFLGERLNLEEHQDVLINSYGATRYRDAFHIQRVIGDAWLFEYGVLVGWNLEEEDRKQLCSEMKELMIEPAERAFTDHYVYSVVPDQAFQVYHDRLQIPDDELLTRLALSHAFAQSSELEYFEERAQQMIQENAYISKELAEKGKVSMSAKKLSKLRGAMFATSSDITLHYNLLDTPEFFWDYPKLESYYTALSKYLDLQPRVEIMNKKLATIQNLLEMLASVQQHKHSSFLEWIIIWLIAIEIVIYFYEKAAGLVH